MSGLVLLIAPGRRKAYVMAAYPALSRLYRAAWASGFTVNGMKASD